MRTPTKINTRPLTLGLAAAAAMLTACASSPRLPDRADAAARNPNTSEAIAQLMKQREEARKLIAKAEKAEADDNPELAIDLYAEALRLDDSIQNAWNNAGTLLMEAGRYADAVTALQRASQLVPTDPRPEYNIGVAYQLNGWGEDAYLHFGYALGRDPSHMPSIRGLVRSAEMTGKASRELLDTIKDATLRESNTEWREYFQRQRYRVEAALANR